MFGPQAVAIDFITSSITALQNKRKTSKHWARENGAFLFSDVSLLLLIAAAASVTALFAEVGAGPAQRNSAADAIAERFAAPEALANDGDRLDFAPLLRDLPVVPQARDNAAETPAAPSEPDRTGEPIVPAGSHADALPDTLGAVVIRNVPPGSSFSRGRWVSPDTWVLAPSDLDGLKLRLPASAAGDFTASIEIYSQGGTELEHFDFTIFRGPAAVAPAGQGEVATGALAGKRIVVKRHRSVRKLPARARPAQRRPVIRKANMTPAAAPVSAVPAGLLAPLFKPAAETADPPKNTSVPAGSKIQIGVYPRHPMEVESLRR